MTNYYVKCKTENIQKCRLVCIQNGQSSHIVMCFGNGYIQTMPYQEFISRLGTALAISDSPVFCEIEKELNSVTCNPLVL